MARIQRKGLIGGTKRHDTRPAGQKTAKKPRRAAAQNTPQTRSHPGQTASRHAQPQTEPDVFVRTDAAREQTTPYGETSVREAAPSRSTAVPDGAFTEFTVPVTVHRRSTVQTLRAEEYDDLPDPPQLRRREDTRRRRARGRRRLVFSTVLLLAAVAWILLAFVCKIGTVAVTGTSVYDESVILEHFGYRVGDNLFSFRSQKAARDIAAALPYLESVRIRRLPPDRVFIEVEPCTEKYCFAFGSTGLITTEDFKVLRQGDNPGNLLTIKGVVTEPQEPGSYIVPSEQLENAEQVIEALAEGHLRHYAELDASDPYDLTLKCEGRYLLRLGTTVDLDYKLRLAAEAIYRQMGPEETGVIDVSSAHTSHAAYYTAQEMPDG